jgi:hypothetical protein
MAAGFLLVFFKIYLFGSAVRVNEQVFFMYAEKKKAWESADPRICAKVLFNPEPWNPIFNIYGGVGFVRPYGK